VCPGTLRGVKPAFALAVVLSLVLWPMQPVAGAAPPAVESMELAGQRYLRLSDWAAGNSFVLRWIQRDEALALTNRNHQLVFQKDSKNCVFDGINVVLSYPVAVHNGVGFIAEHDLRATLAPLLSPPMAAPTNRVRTIVIDPGHGGKDPGFQVGPNQEKKYTLLLALELRDQLKQAGFNVALTRTSDTFVEKSARPEIARKLGADLFISLHWNSASTAKESVRGVQTYCVTPPGAPSSNEGADISDTSAQPGNRNNAKNLVLAYQLQKSIVQGLGTDDRGVRRARFTVLCLAQMPAILIEGGYMSHPAESKRIYDPAYRKQMAHAIVNGVMAYKHLVEPPAPTPAPARSGSPTNSVGSRKHIPAASRGR